jgi:hypothetical protein
MSEYLSKDDTLQVTLLCQIEFIINTMAQKAGLNDKRLYWLDKMSRDIEGINKTYAGILPDGFITQAEFFYDDMHEAVKKLMVECKEETP